MNLTGDLRYVSAAEYAAFAPPTSAPAVRVADGAPPPIPGQREHRQAFSTDGVYGKWLLTKPMLIVINDTVFVHGGLPQAIGALGLGAGNARFHDELMQALTPDGATAGRAAVAERTAVVSRHRALPRAARKRSTAPHLGSTVCAARRHRAHADRDPARAVALLRRRRDARYRNARRGLSRPSERAGDGRRHRSDRRRRRHECANRIAGTRRLRGRVGAERPPSGPTRARRGGAVERRRWRHDGRARGDAGGRAAGGAAEFTARFVPLSSQRQRHELAAYRLDRLLQLGIVAPAAAREIDGSRGVLSDLGAGWTSERARSASATARANDCESGSDYLLMQAFDALIGNAARSVDNFGYDRVSGRTRLRDNGDAFANRRAAQRSRARVATTAAGTARPTRRARLAPRSSEPSAHCSTNAKSPPCCNVATSSLRLGRSWSNRCEDRRPSGGRCC